MPMSRFLVIGGVTAGTTAAARLRRCCGDAEIAIYDAAPFVSYAA